MPDPIAHDQRRLGQLARKPPDHLERKDSVAPPASAQVSTLRERLIRLGVWVERSVRRIVLHLPDSPVYLKDWLRIARSVGAVPA